MQNSYYRENGNLYLSYDQAYECQGIAEAHMREPVKLIETEGYKFLEKLGYKEENGVFRIVRENNERVKFIVASGDVEWEHSDGRKIQKIFCFPKSY